MAVINSMNINDDMESRALENTLHLHSIIIWVLCQNMDGRHNNPHAVNVVVDLGQFSIPTRGMLIPCPPYLP